MRVSIVLLPGLDGTGDLFRPFLDELPSWIEPFVLVFPVDETQDYPALTKFVLRNLPADRPFFLLAESFSGPIAVLIAAAKPAGLLGMILCASFVTAPRPMARVLAPFARLAPAHLLAQIAGPNFLMGRYGTPPLESLFKHTVGKVPRRVLGARFTAAVHVDVRPELTKLDLPVLYLQASDDAIISASAAETFAGACRHGEVRVVEAPHFLLQCSPSSAASAVADFVRVVGSSSHA